jgi:opacity protein-like surface antigen
MKTTSIIVLAAGLALAGAPGAAAQTADPKAYVDVDIAGQQNSTTIATSSIFPLYGESGRTSTSQTVGNGFVFDLGVAYHLRKELVIGVGVSSFTRSPVAAVSVSIPDPLAYNSFTTLAASPQLAQTEQGTHIKVAYVLRVNDKMNVAISAGPSFMHLRKEIASASIVNGAAQIQTSAQGASAVGVNAGLEVNRSFTRRLSSNVFARYVHATVDLPAVSAVRVGRLQAGVGLRLHIF